jgi:uncharacterized protein (TIGR02598 family)
MKTKRKAFSLIEVVIALGLFTGCIVGLVGLLPIAANSVKSVSLESTANNIAESIAGFWQVAPGNATSSGGSLNIGTFTVGAADTDTFYYDNDGFEVPADRAALRLDYEAAPLGTSPSSFTVNLTFTWPPNAAGNSTTATTRTFNYIFTK